MQENQQMHIVNLTRRTIRIVTPSGKVLDSFPPDGMAARLQEVETTVRMVGRTPLAFTAYALPRFLPPSKENTLYIVPLVVAIAGASLGRTDLAVPDNMVRDPKTGRVIGAQRLRVITAIQMPDRE